MQKPSCKVKPRLLYDNGADETFICKVCKQPFMQRSNCIKHVHKHGNAFNESAFSSFKYNGNNIFLLTEKLLLWKARYGISMRAITDDSFSELFMPGALYTDKTNQCMMDAICEQIIELSYKKTTEKDISLIINGGTVMHSKWLAIGYMYQVMDISQFQVLDCVVFENATAANIKNLISSIADEIRNVYKGRVVATCTDNARNFVSVFTEKEDTDFIPLDIIRISCGCHTAQLALKDLHDADEYYRELTRIIKDIPIKFTRMKRSDILNL